MTETILFQYPGACSRVVMTALEEIGLSFSDRLVDLPAGGQTRPDYLAINPKGKVPALLHGGRVMTETPAILHFLDRQHPDAALLPHHEDPMRDNAALADLSWCSGTLHPMVRQVRNPFRFTRGETDGIRADGTEKLTRECAAMAARIGDGWWYGERWSIVDVYLCWAYETAAVGGFPLDRYPALAGHAGRVRARPSFERALARERAAVAGS